MRVKSLLPAILCTSMALAVIPAIAGAEPFTIRVDDLRDGHFSNEQVYGGFGCHGNNVSPRISFTAASRLGKGFSRIGCMNVRACTLITPIFPLAVSRTIDPLPGAPSG